MVSKHKDMITKEQKDIKCGICEGKDEWNRVGRLNTLGALQKWIHHRLKTIPEFKNEEVDENDGHERSLDEWKEMSYSDAVKKCS